MSDDKHPKVKNQENVEPVAEPPKHPETDSWPLISPDTGGSENIMFQISETRPGGAALSHRHPNREHVFYVLSGHGTATVGDESFDVDPGDAYYVPKDVEHGIKSRTRETLKLIVVFSPAEGELI